MVLAQAPGRHACLYEGSSALPGLSGEARVNVLQLHLVFDAPPAGSRSMMPNEATRPDADADALLARVWSRGRAALRGPGVR